MKTKKSIQFTSILVLAVIFSVSLALPASAISEADVQAQVDAVGRETVTGNVLIWFLCAIGFLKAAQKIDSFMASLGVNVGHTGGSMLAEALIAARGVGTIAGAMGHSLGAAGGHRGSSGGNSATASAGGFFKGGLIGMARRKATSDAVRSATSSTSAVRSEQVKSTSEQTASHSAHTSEQAGVRQTATHEGHQTVQQTAAKTAEHTSHAASEVTRIEMAEWSYENGYWCSKSGSYHALIPAAAKAWGLPVEGCSASEPQRIVDALSEGKLVVALMTKGHFTSSGHFIVLRGVENEQILVADPASTTRSQKAWDLSIILNEASKSAAAGGPFWIIG